MTDQFIPQDPPASGSPESEAATEPETAPVFEAAPVSEGIPGSGSPESEAVDDELQRLVEPTDGHADVPDEAEMPVQFPPSQADAGAPPSQRPRPARQEPPKGRVAPAPRWRLSPNWSWQTLVACVILVGVTVVALTLAFGLIKDQTQALFDYASRSSGHKYEEDVPYPLLICLALVPAVVIGAAVWFIDRWEPEPVVMYVIAIGWGAGVSVLVSFDGNGWWSQRVLGMAANSAQYDVMTKAVGAAIIEESAKGLGLIVIFFALNKYVNGPMDGLVYGLLVGMGFAFTENILYFARASVAETVGGSVDLSGMETWTIGSLFFARAILTPLVHPLATAVTGLFVGLATTSRKPYVAIFPMAIVGCALAALLHGLHNYSSIKRFADEPATRMMLQLPVYIGAAVLIYFVAGMQRRDVHRGLVEYSRAGWLSANEVRMVMSLVNRRKARLWAGASAAELGRTVEAGSKAMRSFQNELIHLGYTRSINVQRRTAHTEQVRRKEAERLAYITELRKVFTTPAKGREQHAGI